MWARNILINSSWGIDFGTIRTETIGVRKACMLIPTMFSSNMFCDFYNLNNLNSKYSPA